MASVLITGASGMIGMYLTSNLLQKKHRVFGVDSRKNDYIGTDSNYTFVQCDITDKDSIEGIIASNKIDSVVHLANSVDNDIDPYVTDAEIKKSKICDKFIYEIADKHMVKNFLLLSTTQIYGNQKGREPIRETNPEKGSSNYVDLKLTSEKYKTVCEEKRDNSCYYFNEDTNGFDAKIDLDESKLVFFSVPYEQGWTAEVNGEPADIEKVSYGFMAVKCPAGDNTITFRYKTAGLAEGKIISLAGWGILVVYIAANFAYRKKHPEKVLVTASGEESEQEPLKLELPEQSADDVSDQTAESGNGTENETDRDDRP